MRQGRARRPAGGESGAGSALAVGLIGSIVAVTAMALPLYVALAARQAVAGAADAAALAAADVAIGILPGYPCESAARVAAANGASLVVCELDGLVATVAASRTVAGLAVTAWASAGPAPSAAD